MFRSFMVLSPLFYKASYFFFIFSLAWYQEWTWSHSFCVLLLLLVQILCSLEWNGFFSLLLLLFLTSTPRGCCRIKVLLWISGSKQVEGSVIMFESGEREPLFAPLCDDDKKTWLFRLWLPGGMERKKQAQERKLSRKIYHIFLLRLAGDIAESPRKSFTRVL